MRVLKFTDDCEECIIIEEVKDGSLRYTSLYNWKGHGGSLVLCGGPAEDSDGEILDRKIMYQRFWILWDQAEKLPEGSIDDGIVEHCRNACLETFGPWDEEAVDSLDEHGRVVLRKN